MAERMPRATSGAEVGGAAFASAACHREVLFGPGELGLAKRQAVVQRRALFDGGNQVVDGRMDLVAAAPGSSHGLVVGRRGGHGRSVGQQRP